MAPASRTTAENDPFNETTREAMPKDWQAEAPVHLTAPARRIAWQASMEQELPDAPFDRGERTAIRLVPFGCTQMRVSMFPIAKP